MKEKAIFLILCILSTFLALSYMVALIYNNVFSMISSAFGLLAIQNYAVGKMIIKELQK